MEKIKQSYEQTNTIPLFIRKIFNGQLISSTRTIGWYHLVFKKSNWRKLDKLMTNQNQERSTGWLYYPFENTALTQIIYFFYKWNNIMLGLFKCSEFIKQIVDLICFGHTKLDTLCLPNSYLSS